MKVKYTRSSLLFLIAYMMWIAVTLLKYTYIKDLFPTRLSLNDVLEYTKWLTYVLLSLKFWDDGIYRFRNLVGLAIVFCMGYVEYSVQDKTVQLFMLCIFIYSAANVDFDDILKVTLIVEVLVFVITIGFSFSGVIPNNIWDEGGRHRYDLGFMYCTFGSHLMLFITMVYSCIRKRITFIETVVLAAVSFWLYSYNDTRIDLCIVIPFLVFFYIWTHFSVGVRKNFITKAMFQYSGVIIAAISIIIQSFYNPNIGLFMKMNELLSNRLYLGEKAVSEYGFTLFGQQIRWIGQGSVKSNPSLAYNYVDCSFLKYTLNYGVFFLVLLLIGLIYIGKKAIERDEQAICVSLLFLYVFAMVDAELCVLAFHPFLLKMGELLNPIQRKEMRRQKERIICLDNMLLYILRQWKIFVIGIIVIGIIFGSTGFIKVNKKYRLVSNKKQITTEKICISGADLTNVDMILNLEQEITNQKEYNDNSILMRITPQEKRIASVKYQFCISKDTAPELHGSYLEEGKKAYQNVFNRDEIYEYIKESLSLEFEEKYIKELVSLEMDSAEEIVINVIAPDDELAQGIREGVKDYLRENNANILKNHKDLTVKIDSEHIVTVVDMNLQNTQTAQYSNLLNLQSVLEARKLVLSDKAKQYLELAKKEYKEGNYESGQVLYQEVTIENKEVSTRRKIYEAGIYSIKRVLLFICFLIMCFGLRYIWSAKLMYAYDLQEMYGIKVIELISKKDSSANDRAVDNITANISDGNDVLVISSDMEEMDIKILEDIKAALKRNHISAEILFKMDGFDAFKSIKDSKNIIIVESISKSKYSNIEKCIDNIYCLNREIIGAMVIS